MPISDEILNRALDPVPTTWQPKPGYRAAAVLAPLFSREGRDWLLFTLRRSDLPHHPGQVSFPGGAREGEEQPEECALRETEEETGLEPGAVRVLGSLPPRLSIAGFWVQPMVGRIPAPTDLHPDPAEVARLLEIPLDHLVQDQLWEMRVPSATDRPRPAIPHFDWDGTTLWGLTARFTLELLDRIRAEEPGS